MLDIFSKNLSIYSLFIVFNMNLYENIRVGFYKHKEQKVRLFEYIQQGGPIMYLLLVLNIIGIALMASKFLQFNQHNDFDNIASDLSNAVKDSGLEDESSKIELAKQELNGHINSLEKGLNTIKIIASISPLLGLLGTVIGVLSAFKIMSMTGLNDPSSFANGISMALLTTVGGMVVAIPHYIGHSYLLGMLDKIESQVEKSLIKRIL